MEIPSGCICKIMSVAHMGILYNFPKVDPFASQNIIINFNWSRKYVVFLFCFVGTKNPNYNVTENVTKHVETNIFLEAFFDTHSRPPTYRENFKADILQILYFFFMSYSVQHYDGQFLTNSNLEITSTLSFHMGKLFLFCLFARNTFFFFNTQKKHPFVCLLEKKTTKK